MNFNNIKSLGASAAIMAFIFLPFSANAGIGYGIIMGNGMLDKSQSAAIPPACYYAEHFWQYRDCRMLTAKRIYPIGKETTYMIIEYKNYILPLQKDKRTNP